ncbi:MAG: DUF1311 domain-containing protein [Xanthobacteraceae bacterium]|nr:DUF1311 domain-containing protein [Xanthobacteraceae bacterium]
MRAALAFALLCLSAALACAQQTRPSRELCDSKTLSGRPYFLCLEKAMRETHQAMETLITRINDLIDSRADLAPAQRSRWKSSLEEAQILFVRFRNQECQAVAPFEGQGWARVGTFEERLLCLIDKNVTRTRELEARYTK